MSYQIIITQTKTAVKTLPRLWVKLGEKEVEREGRFYSADQSEPKTRIEPVMGYTPDIDGPVSETTEVLKQTVDELDLTAVIKAVNKL